MGLLIRLIIFPILLVRRILWPMFMVFLKTPIRIGKFFIKSSLLIYFVAFVIIYMAVQSWSGGGGGEVSEPAPVILSKKEDPRTREKVVQLPPITGSVEDGNSSFAKSLWGKMDPKARAVYSREFTYAMHYTQPGEAHLFTTPGDALFGQIEPGSPYTAKGGTKCRNFEEVISYQRNAQRFHGKACQRTGGKGWCKLKPESTPNCEIGYSEGGLSGLQRKVKRWF